MPNENAIKVLQSADEALRKDYFALTLEWLELESQNDLANNERSNDIIDQLDAIATEFGARREVVIVVRGGVATIARNTDESDTLITIVDYDDEAEEPVHVTQS